MIVVAYTEVKIPGRLAGALSEKCADGGCSPPRQPLDDPQRKQYHCRPDADAGGRREPGRSPGS